MMQEQRTIILAEYAAGTMDDGLALVVASYLSFCADSRAYVGDCHRLAGTMLETLCEPVGMTEGSLQRVLARLGEDAPCAQAREKRSLCDDIALPDPLAALLCAGKGLRWRRVTGGSRIAPMPQPCGGTQVIAMDIAPGRALPEHAHSGMELTLVLRGAYNDEFGHYTAGTLAVYEAGTAHRPVADARQGCVCVTAVEGMQNIAHPLARFFSQWRR